MERYICIHGHFYQPPRENAWLEFVELQDSAYPFHDWNELITAECYAPNGRSRIIGADGDIERITNNYTRISYDFGPTLLAWMAEEEPETYRLILEADKESQAHFSGHGSAIAQSYNDTIPPLSTSRDKYTQILWGRRIAGFFHDGPISEAIAFERLLERGENFAERLVSAFSDSRPWPQIVHIATDGETYGHHHKRGEMALAYALHHIESNNLAKLTNYAEYLERHPATNEAEIWDRTAWSCVHGVERWNSNCGCNSGGYPNWNQEWRLPLRQALDWLRDTAAAKFEEKGRELFKDPWQARNDY